MTGLLVLTLNIWGLLHVSRRREERVQQLGKHLASCEADLVALQEVWVEGDAVSLAAAAARGGRLVHSHSFKSGLFGPGEPAGKGRRAPPRTSPFIVKHQAMQFSTSASYPDACAPQG